MLAMTGKERRNFIPVLIQNHIRNKTAGTNSLQNIKYIVELKA